MSKVCDFWVLPCKELANAWVVYTDEGQEILIKVKQGKIISESNKLSVAHREYFNKNILPINNLNMESKIMQGISPMARLQQLKDNAEKSEIFNYPKGLGEDQLLNLKDELTKDSVALVKLEEKRKEFLTELKSEVKPLKQKVAITLTKLRNRVEEVEEEVYLLADQEEGLMGYYNRDGFLVHQRVLLPEERQFRIIDATKTGTNQ